MAEKGWLDNFNRGVPDKYPILFCGWPDETHGIDHESYMAECITAIEDLCPGQDAPVFKTFQEWKIWKREQDPDRDTLGFSWHPCDICGALAGYRYAVTAYKDLEGLPRGDYLTLEVCGDCLCYIANGDLPCRLEDQ